jgi:hypothetical protein
MWGKIILSPIHIYIEIKMLESTRQLESSKAASHRIPDVISTNNEEMVLQNLRTNLFWSHSSCLDRVFRMISLSVVLHLGER